MVMAIASTRADEVPMAMPAYSFDCWGSCWGCPGSIVFCRATKPPAMVAKMGIFAAKLAMEYMISDFVMRNWEGGAAMR